jgi:hypothetical protein
MCSATIRRTLERFAVDQANRLLIGINSIEACDIDRVMLLTAPVRPEEGKDATYFTEVMRRRPCPEAVRHQVVLTPKQTEIGRIDVMHHGTAADAERAVAANQVLEFGPYLKPDCPAVALSSICLHRFFAPDF